MGAIDLDARNHFGISRHLGRHARTDAERARDHLGAPAGDQALRDLALARQRRGGGAALCGKA
jgi:hypothetical protein